MTLETSDAEAEVLRTEQKQQASKGSNVGRRKMFPKKAA